MSRVWAVVVILARMSVAAAEEPVAGEPSSAVASEGDVRALRLVYTGGRRGLMATQHRFELHERLQEALADRAVEVQSVDVVHGVLAQGPHLVLPVDGHLASLRDGLSVEAPRCGEGVTVEAWVTDTEELLIEPGALPVAALGDARREARIWRRCEAGGHEMVWVAPSAEPGEPSWQLGAFDVRTGFRHGLSEGAGVWWQIARPRLEPGRHIAALRQALAEHDGALFVHAGDFLGGASALHVGELSVHREVQLAAVSALKPAALAPGHGELAGGVSRFFEEAARYGLPYVATNWRAEDPALALPAVRRVVVATPGGPVDVALLGVVDPLVGVTSPALADAGIELVEPVAAVHEVVDALWAGEDPPDVVVLLARVEPRLQADLRARLHGVDLLVGDITAATYRVEEERTTFRQVSRSFKASPVTLPMDGVTIVSLDLDGAGLVQVRARPVPVLADAPTDPDVTRAITEVRLVTYPTVDQVLVPARGGAPLHGVDTQLWQRLVCEAMLEVTGADVAFLGELPARQSTPGPLTELLARQRLAVLDQLELHRVDGSRVVDLLKAADGVAPIQCGAPTGGGAGTARGRALEPDRTYLAVTTDRTRRTSGLGDLLAGAAVEGVGRRPVGLLREEGTALTLSDAVIERLRRWRDEATAATWPADVAARSATDMPAQWLLRVRRLSFEVERFQGAGAAAYDQVPETLINSPSSLSLGGDLDLAVDYSSARVLSDLRVRASYTQLTVQGAAAQETADDWRASLSLSLPVAGFPAGRPMRLMPYAEVLYDSEFTPGIDAEGVVLSRQSDLSITAGLSSTRWSWVRLLRLGAFVNRDLARLEDKGTEYGGRFEAETGHSFLPRSALGLSTAWDVQVFGDTPLDDAADLRLRAWAEARLAVRLVRWLRLAVYMDALVVQGRVPETRQVAASWSVGAALDLSAAFSLGPRR